MFTGALKVSVDLGVIYHRKPSNKCSFQRLGELSITEAIRLLSRADVDG